MKNHHITRSLWKVDGPMLNFAPVESDVEADIAVIGGGITGITCALLLQRRGKKVVLLEAGHIGAGTTGRTTAHLTSMLDERYFNIVKHVGEEKAALVAGGVRQSLLKIHEFVKEFEIDCDLREVDGYLYTEEKNHVEMLQKEVEAASKVGVEVEYVESVPLPFTVYGAAKFGKQYYFHPMRYLEGLARAFVDSGGTIFERSRVSQVKDGKPCQVRVGNFTVRAAEVVEATHTPLGMSLLHTELRPFMSYVLAAEIKGPVPQGIFWDTYDPYFYTRPLHDRGRDLLIVGGKDHHTGRCADTDLCFEQLEDYLRRRYEVNEVVYRWSAEFYYPVDGLPLIGRSPLAQHIHVSTGYASEGLTFGTLGATLVCEEILQEFRTLHSVLSPSRLAALTSPKQFVTENLGNATHFVTDRLKPAEAEAIADVPVGEGKIVLVNGHKVAVYRESDEKIYAMSPTCQHMGCFVSWNQSEKTWDCPCHGGRYSAEGEVLEGPPLRALRHVDLPIEVPVDKKRVPREERYDAPHRLEFGKPMNPVFD